MVEAIEDLFIPVIVYNNKQVDAATLKKFDEPSWNNPVTRFLNHEANDVVARQTGVWNRAAMAARMVAALEATDQSVPDYLQMLAAGNTSLEKATFAMYCYWSGEGKLGSIPGVHDTRSAWLGGHEVVELVYDPAAVEYEKLVTAAQEFECASKVFTHSEEQLAVAKASVGGKAVAAPGKSRVAKLSDQKYYLRNTPGVRSLPLTQLQSTKINSALMARVDYRPMLSPRQKELLAQIRLQPPKSLEGLVFPDNDAGLGAYKLKLMQRLNATK